VGRTNLTFSKVFNSDGVTLSDNQHEVSPGQIAEFDFNLQAPAGTKAGYYQEYFQPVLEGAPGNYWGMGGNVWMGVNVR
jgi:hypothetical protein